MKLLLLSDLDFLEMLSQKQDLMKILCILVGSFEIIDLTFSMLSIKGKQGFVAENVIALNGAELMSATRMKQNDDIHIADCANINYCAQNKRILVTNDDAVCRVAKRYGVETMDSNDLLNSLTRRKMG